VSALIHATVKEDPTIITDLTRDEKTGKTRWEALLENSRKLKIASPSLETARSFDISASPESAVPTPVSRVVTPAPSSSSDTKSPVRQRLGATATNKTPAPYNPMSTNWSDMQQSPSYIAFQDRLKKRKEAEAKRKEDEAKAYNQSLIDESISRRKRQPWAAF